MAANRPKKLATLMAQLRAAGIQEYEDEEIRLVFGEQRLVSVPASAPKKKGVAISARAPLHSMAAAALDGFTIYPDVVE